MTTDPQIEMTRLKFTICEQAAEIDRQRDEIDRLLGWVSGDSDALTCLQTVYNNSTSSEANKVRAASAAIGYERAKAASTDRKSTRLNSSHRSLSRMPSSA